MQLEDAKTFKDVCSWRQNSELWQEYLFTGLELIPQPHYWQYVFYIYGPGDIF